jgi:transcription antitermination factor NusG
MAADTTGLIMPTASDTLLGGKTIGDVAMTAGGFAGTMPRVGEWPGLPAEYWEARWYAAYTSANHEKRVAEQLVVREVEHFLPTYSSVRRWKDRRVTLQLPLFPGYIFVRMVLRDRLRVQQIPGVVQLVGFNGVPTALREEEIAVLRITVNAAMRIQPHPHLCKGCRVRIRYGPLRGAEGILLRKNKLCRVVLSVNLIASSVALEVDAADVERIG